MIRRPPRSTLSPYTTLSRSVNESLASSEVVVYTSRELVTAGKAGSTGLTNFQIGAAVSDALVEVMRRVGRTPPLSFVGGKGGITLHDIANQGPGGGGGGVGGTMLAPA